MSLLAALKPNGPSGFGYGTTAEQATEGVDMRGKTVLITGSNSGLGVETARVLALRGAHVIAAARTKDKAAAACAGMGEITPVACELSEPASVRACIEEVNALGRPLDAILCNAGIMALPRLEQKYGYELQFFTNHIGHFLLITGLLDKLAERGRVVLVSSAAHTAAPKEGIPFDNLSGDKGYDPWRNYGQSKLANLLCARELGRRLAGTGKTANALHPGVIPTNLGRHMSAVARVALSVAKPLFLKSIPQGAATQCYVAAHPGAAEINGAYFADCNIASSSPQGQNLDQAKKLWEVSEEIVAKL